MLSVSETTCRLTVVAFFLAFLLGANKVLQSYARNLRATSRSIMFRMTGVFMGLQLIFGSNSYY